MVWVVNIMIPCFGRVFGAFLGSSHLGEWLIKGVFSKPCRTIDEHPFLGGFLTMVINHLSNGMILQVGGFG